jgi:DNA-directed RNA polymerase specialized sigma24 family protein
MPEDPNAEPASLLVQPLQETPLPEGADQFAARMFSMLDGQPKDDAVVEEAFAGMDDVLDQIAAGLYRMASMLVGEGENAIRLVETAIATADVSACSDAMEARKSSRRALCAEALDTLAGRDAASLATPEGLEHAATCINDDDLDAAGESNAELEQMMAGADNDHMRVWLESLPTAMRTIFVLRAVAGFSTGETAELLREHGGASAAGWNGDAVRELFRQGMCSLASQALHAAR